MALSDDQKALLRLLAQRDEGYEDIGALMGLSVEQVRSRVREALAALNGGTEAGGRPEAPRAVAAPPQEPSPTPEPDRHAPEPARAAPPRRGAQASQPGRPGRAARPPLRRPRGLAPPRDRRRRLELAGGAVAVILLVLFATGLVSIEGGGGSKPGSAARSEAAGGASSKLTQAVLRPVNGGEAIGRALFGRVGKGVVLQVVAQGLDPSPPGRSYAVWLYRSPKVVLRVGAVKVGKSGGIAARFPVPTELLAYVAGGAFKQIDVSLASDAAYRAAVARAKREKRLPPYSGTDILRGDITGPIVKK